MAATTTAKLLQLRPIYRRSTTGSTSIQFFSASSNTSDPDENSPQTNSTSPPPPPPKSPSSFSSYLDDVKATLKQQQGDPQSQPPRLPFNISSSSSTSNAPPRSSFRIGYKEEIEKNISEFRRRSAVPPPSSAGSAPQPPQHFSFEELYQRNAASSGEESSSAGSKVVGKPQWKAITESLKHLRTNIARTQNERVGKINDTMSLSKYKESLKLKPGDQSGRDLTRVIGGSDRLPLSIFGKEMREKDGDSANADTSSEFVRIYSHKDLGERLKSLRPEKKGDWFSLQELNERLMTLREIDKNESDSHGGILPELRDALGRIGATEQNQKKPKPSVDILRQLGRTPSFMLSPPQEHLIEKYFHPDNMSASERLKLELKKVRDEFKMSESDCGSARIQVAQLTTKIKHLSTVLHKKDKHSRKGLQGMVQKRKTLLKYLRRTDWESYCFVLSKLGLRDNPDYKN